MLEVPNHTQVPNVFIDKYTQNLNGAAVKIFLAICRKTIGWHKLTDKISYSQLKEITGLKSQAIITAIKDLEVRGLIRTEKEKGKTTTYEILFIPTSLKIKEHLFENQTGTSLKIKHTKETLKETKQKKTIVLADNPDKKIKAWLKDGFLKLNDNHFSNYEKEATAIKGLVKKAKNVAGDGDLQDFLRGMIQKFIAKKKSGKGDYWKDVPLLPSSLNQRWDQVYAVAKDEAIEMDKLKNNPILQGFLNRGQR